MELHNIRHASHLFTNCNGRFVAEESTLRANNPLGRSFGPVYDDACDEGFTIVSNRTGREVALHVDREERAPDGEVLAWHLKPTRESARRVPEAAGLHVVVIND